MKITTIIVPVTTALFCSLLTSLFYSIVTYAATDENALHVEYAGGSSEPYVVMTDPGEKYTISQSYSWVRDETSRYNLVSYSVDDGDYIDISRKARGDFILDILMDSPHSVRFLAVVQYPISVGGTSELTIDFSPPSPTHDNWFDLNSEVTISVPYTTTAESPGTRQQLVSWSFDKSAAKHIAQSDNESDSFTTKVRMSGPHTIEFVTKTQHYVNVISEYGTATSSGWYDVGTTATISMIPPMEEFLVQHSFAGWDGAAIIAPSEGYSASIIIDSPKTVVAKWTADYSQLLMLVVAGIATAGGIAAVTLKKKMKGKLPSSARITNSATVYEEAPQQISPTTTLSVSASAVVVEQQQPDENNNNSGSSNSYQNQIMEYALQKSIEKLEMLCTSGMISDAKFSRIKQELEQMFH